MTSKNWHRALLAGFVWAALAGAAPAALIAVTGTADENSSTPPNGVCTLREAILSANGNVSIGGCPPGAPGSDTINLPSATYVLTIPGIGEDAGETGDLDIREDVTLAGLGSPGPVVDGNALDYVIHVQNATTGLVDIGNLTVRNGTLGGILNQSGTLGLKTVTAANNAVTGLIAAGSVTMSDGWIHHNGDMGIYVAGVLTVDRTLIEDNTGGYAGGIFNYGQVTITRSTIRNNTGGTAGGLLNGITAAVSDSTIELNSASGGPGGIMSACFPHPPCPSYLTVGRSTVSGNTGDGLLLAGAIAKVANSTISANTGKGIVNAYGSSTTLNHVTVAANGVGAVDNSAYLFSPATLVFENTLVSGACLLSSLNVVVSHGGNLESPGSTCSLSGPGDLMGAPSAGIAPLASNGGPTQTHALYLGSPAIGRGQSAYCQPTDQRGIARPAPITGNCDTGAYEYTGCGASLAAMLPPVLLVMRRRRGPSRIRAMFRP